MGKRRSVERDEGDGGKQDERGRDAPRREAKHDRPFDVIRDVMAIYRAYPSIRTEVIVASVRHGEHVRESAAMGAHIATVPPKILDSMVGHPLTDKGLAAFLADWEKAKRGATARA